MHRAPTPVRFSSFVTTDMRPDVLIIASHTKQSLSMSEIVGCHTHTVGIRSLMYSSLDSCVSMCLCLKLNACKGVSRCSPFSIPLSFSPGPVLSLFLSLSLSLQSPARCGTPGQAHSTLVTRRPPQSTPHREHRVPLSMRPSSLPLLALRMLVLTPQS